MKNKISIHNSKIFNKEHDFRESNTLPNVCVEKSKDNIYFENNSISKEYKNNTYQFIISFPEGFIKNAIKNTLIEYMETFQNRIPTVRVNYGAIHCDELNTLPHLHLTYTKVNEMPDDFSEKEKAHLNSLYIKYGMQVIKEYITTHF